MRIFVATGIFHPEPGGPATYLYRLLPELVARGHTVRALTFGRSPCAGQTTPAPPGARCAALMSCLSTTWGCR